MGFQKKSVMKMYHHTATDLCDNSNQEELQMTEVFGTLNWIHGYGIGIV